MNGTAETGSTWGQAQSARGGHASDRRQSRALVAALLALLVAVVLVRWIELAAWANQIPFWDQWDSEVAFLYRPFLDHQLSWSTFIAPHNEHRILFTRLFGLLLFVLNDTQFDNRVTTFANAILYAIAWCIFARPLLAQAGGAWRWLCLLVLCVLGTVPFGWENLLSGFQSAFYALFGFTVFAIDRIAHSRDGDRATAAALCLAVASLFCMASGNLLALILAALGIVLWRNGRWARARTLVFCSLCLAVTLIGFKITPHVAAHDGLKATGLAMFASGAMRNIAWPLDGKVAALVLWLPFLFGGMQALLGRWRDERVTGLDFFLLAIAGWVLLQALAMAYSRALPTIVVSRYTDILLLGALCNFALAWRMVQRLQPPMRTAGLVVCACAGLILGNAYVAKGRQAMDEARDRASLSQRQQQHLVDYLSGAGLSAWSSDTPGLELSYPSRERLSGLLADGTVQRLLPASIRKPLAINWPDCPGMQSPGTYPTTPAARDRAVFGSYDPLLGDRAEGRCESGVFTTPFPYVRWQVAGYLGRPDVSLALQAAEDPERMVRVTPPRQIAGASWRAVSSAMPAERSRALLVDSSPSTWIAVSAPTEQGRLSHLVELLAKHLGDPRL